jgi:hypothetical protein
MVIAIPNLLFLLALLLGGGLLAVLLLVFVFVRVLRGTSN